MSVKVNYFAGCRRRRRRVLALLGAIAANSVLLWCVSQPGEIISGSPAPPSLTLVLVSMKHLAVSAATERPPRELHNRPTNPPIDRRVANDLPMPFVPSTETARSLPVLPPEEDAEVEDRRALASLCARDARSDGVVIPTDGTVEIRVFVGPDGRIVQGAVAKSSENPLADLALLKCVETYANVRPALRDQEPIGTWRHLQWNWAVP